ncbi:MAG TPA: hypothetical protein VKZ80_05560 [Flavobacterium sp.]|mgnify:CR=1 FL=1|nr:hypothetical protein [Flavobacterium sp.]
MDVYAFSIGFLIFLNITFWISSYDKVFDFKGNLQWMIPHFAQSPLKNVVPLALTILTFFEVATAFMSAFALYELLVNDTLQWVFFANVFHLIALFLMLIAQRLAKDFDGARTIVIYLIPGMIALLIL